MAKIPAAAPFFDSAVQELKHQKNAQSIIRYRKLWFHEMEPTMEPLWGA